jgi:hypothetical protein
MRTHSIIISILVFVPATAVLHGAEEGAPKNELAFGLGGLISISYNATQERVGLGPGIGSQVNYGHQIETWQ